MEQLYKMAVNGYKLSKEDDCLRSTYSLTYQKYIMGQSSTQAQYSKDDIVELMGEIEKEDKAKIANLEAEIQKMTEQMMEMTRIANESKKQEELKELALRTNDILQEEISFYKKELNELDKNKKEVLHLRKENEILQVTIKTFQERDLKKDLELQEANKTIDEMESDNSEMREILRAQQNDNLKIIEIANRSQQRYHRSRTVCHLDSLKKDLNDAKTNCLQRENNRQQWETKTETLQNLVHEFGNITLEDNTGIYSESSDSSTADKHEVELGTCTPEPLHSDSLSIQDKYEGFTRKENNINIYNVSITGQKVDFISGSEINHSYKRDVVEDMDCNVE